MCLKPKVSPNFDEQPHHAPRADAGALWRRRPHRPRFHHLALVILVGRDRSSGYRVEDIEDPLTQKVRYLDKLVDELAKGRAMEKILRKCAGASGPECV